ncbi:hypothetical protein CFP56_022599 [Quercus suber]|uniref:Uncharacterized protein n=1 Tax=Quercus suber TaxID=58331 RepID=A0AAW0LYK5_QUESU
MVMEFVMLVSQNIRSGRLRAFAFAGLESLCCSILPWMSETHFSFINYIDIARKLGEAKCCPAAAGKYY